jgi:hypothetical protein
MIAHLTQHFTENMLMVVYFDRFENLEDESKILQV